MHLELSISPCPNDTFMFDALLGGRIDCEGLTFAPAFHDIEELNRALRDAAPGAGPDMSKVSCALLPEIADRYEVLDSGAALGRGNGPLLVRRRGDRTPLRHVAVPGLHTTANALLRLLHPEIMERTPVLFSEIAAAVERGDYDAGVLIHEGRFVFGDRNLERVADLGEEWEARTGLPLPLGAIVVRRTLPEAVRRRCAAVLRRSIEYAFAHPGASRPFVRAHARELDDAVTDAHIALFVNEYSLSLGAEGRRALETLAPGALGTPGTPDASAAE
ncbi:1,4-dihydroxy-6-naphthoate synthase [uncultured Alistipes sp.]|nr:1,4-dihydroxy-6-naphthoate synthase [uncultured Alistipes sp.]